MKLMNQNILITTLLIGLLTPVSADYLDNIKGVFNDTIDTATKTITPKKIVTGYRDFQFDNMGWGITEVLRNNCSSFAELEKSSWGWGTWYEPREPGVIGVSSLTKFSDDNKKIIDIDIKGFGCYSGKGKKGLSIRYVVQNGQDKSVIVTYGLMKEINSDKLFDMVSNDYTLNKYRTIGAVNYYAFEDGQVIYSQKFLSEDVDEVFYEIHYHNQSMANKKMIEYGMALDDTSINY